MEVRRSGEAEERFEERGDEVAGSVSVKAGQGGGGPGAGSKLTKAQALEIPIMDEAEFIDFLSRV